MFNLNPILFTHYVTDLANVFKVLHDYKFSNFFQEIITFALTSNLRRSNRLNHSLTILPIRNMFDFWLERIIPLWNSLDERTVTARSVKSFKKRLLSHDHDKIVSFCNDLLSRT